MNIQNPFIVFGEALWDVFPDQARLGGAPLNFAYYFSRAGGRPLLVSALGRDQLGRQALAEIKKRGVATECIQESSRPTGQVMVEIKGGQPRFTIIRGTAWESIEYPGKSADIKGACGMYVGTLSRISETNRKVMDRLLAEFADRPRFMDINLRQNFYSRDDILFLLERIDYLKMNDKEARILRNMGLIQGRKMEQLAGSAIERFGLKACCLTLGERGAVAGDIHGCLRKPAVPATPGGDAVGAGDAFGAFWLAELLKGSSLQASLERAIQVGSVVASHRGAVVDL